MGISRDSRHKRAATGAKRAYYRKKRKFELGRQPANTKIGPKRIHEVRTRGGNQKFRAMRLDSGNFSWGSEGITRPARISAVAYHPNNEFSRTNTLTRGAVVTIDATAFKSAYESYYGQTIGKKKGQQQVQETDEKKSKKLQRKQASRAGLAKVEPTLDHQFAQGRLLAIVTSRPGQSGRLSGEILERDQLAFYMRKMQSKK